MPLKLTVSSRVLRIANFRIVKLELLKDWSLVSCQLSVEPISDTQPKFMLGSLGALQLIF